MAAVQAVRLDLQPLRRGFQAARRRLWLQSWIRAMAQAICLGLSFALAAALLTAWRAPEPAIRGLWAASAAAPTIASVAGLILRPSTSKAARAIDLRLGLLEQLGTAEELLAKGASGDLAWLQIAKASNLAQTLPLAKALPLLPKRETVVAFLLAAATSSVLAMISLGISLPNPLSAIRLPHLSREALQQVGRDLPDGLRQKQQPNSRSPGLDSLRQTLDDIRRESQNGALPPAVAAAALARANADLNRMADLSRTQQQALDSLADELQGTAAGREAAESLRHGDYDRAAAQLSEVGRQSDQLSSAAKRELSNALDRAAMRSQAAQPLSASETRAAQALRQGDYGSVAQSMDQLARSVQESASQMVPQSELADTWQRIEQMSKQLGGLDPRSNQNGRALSPPDAQAPQASGERKARLEQGAPGDTQNGDAGHGDAESRMAGGQPGGGSSPGNTRGGPPMGDQSERLTAGGSRVEVQGKIGDRFPGEPSSDVHSPSVLRQGRASSSSSAATVGSGGPISVPPENVFVPGDRRPIVRNYFSRGSGGQ